MFLSKNQKEKKNWDGNFKNIFFFYGKNAWCEDIQFQAKFKGMFYCTVYTYTNDLFQACEQTGYDQGDTWKWYAPFPANKSSTPELKNSIQ